ncbi:hypothetical protein Q7Z90_09370 [Glaesserella parasuis]|uniref:hypothetical protein n=1 Tax=Glaesserella parasuis TaxID=738 RepID=UPI00047B91E4|nr:hypothetical protein [Glaesserella parasuis]MDP0329004.1 hypothetical protein [Glaesserella parasuis]MDP0391616.1 hypothetical protein [Glaesserella parasuis]
MRPETATKFNTYLAGVAQDNSVDYNHIFTGKNFVSSNDDFVVENYAQVALLKNISMLGSPDTTGVGG